jgi:putative membrane protein
MWRSLSRVCERRSEDGLLYLSIKTLHVIAIIAWMAGLLYLPRLFVYHSDAPVGSPQSETFKTMEGRLYRAIMVPAMVISWLAGLFLAWNGGWQTSGWLHVKLAAVVLLTGAHHFFGATVRAFGRDERPRSARFFRIANEIPTLLMILIVAMAVLKPF